jgi:flagellum-specific ATP synthase
MPTLEIPSIHWDLYHRYLAETEPIRQTGRVEEIIGLIIESRGPAGSIGDTCLIQSQRLPKPVPVEIVGFRKNKTLLMPLGLLAGISPGDEIISLGTEAGVPVGEQLIGRVIDGLGEPLDGKGPIAYHKRVSLHREPTEAMSRRRIEEIMPTGVRAIDSLITLGEGQRVGIFAGSGVGKSTLLGMIARYSEAEIIVVALVGERSREVRDFIEKDLGPEGLARSVVVIATSDRPALVRIRAAHVAMSIAEYFRDEGKKVAFMMDSVTRMALAQREVGLAVGEPPTSRGYTPSVFMMLPRFLERCGTSAHRGSITGLITVLVEGDDMNEPISDAVRSILDGHIALSRRFAHMNHYPAIDPLRSISRVMSEIVEPRHKAAAGMIRSRLALYEEMEDMINLGAYRKGTNPELDVAIEKKPETDRFLRQDPESGSPFEQTKNQLIALASGQAEGKK